MEYPNRGYVCYQAKRFNNEYIFKKYRNIKRVLDKSRLSNGEFPYVYKVKRVVAGEDL